MTEVEVYQAFLTVENKRVRLTKSVAKQFPIQDLRARRGVVSKVREPVCKVAGKTLGHSAYWLYLVEDEEAGLVWEPACVYRGDYAEGMRKRGYNVDDPASVETVIL